MTNGRRIGKSPQNVVSNQRLSLRIFIDQRLDMSLQEIGGNRHLKSPFNLIIKVCDVSDPNYLFLNRPEDNSCHWENRPTFRTISEGGI